MHSGNRVATKAKKKKKVNHVSPRPQNAILNKSNEYVYLTRYNVTLARLRGSVTAVIELGQSFVLRWLLCCSTHTDTSNRIQHIRKVFRATYFFFIRTSEWVLKLLCTQRMQNKGELLIFNALFCEKEFIHVLSTDGERIINGLIS